MQVIAFKEATDKVSKHSFQIGESYAFFYPQAFSLVEHGRVRSVAVHAVNAAGGDNADGWLFFVEHIADLNRGSVRTQNVAVFNVESILHRTRWVICRNIQGLEIMEIVFDFRAVRCFKTHTVKQLDHTLQSQSNWMQTAMFLRTARQSNIQCFCSQLSLQLGFI